MIKKLESSRLKELLEREETNEEFIRNCIKINMKLEKRISVL